MRRWHWFGDKTKIFHPHLNILVEGKYLREDSLEQLKNGLRNLLISPQLKVILGKTLDIHYSYTESPKSKFKKVRYIARATFLDYAWDKKLAIGLKGFRNASWWGTWRDEPVWSLDKPEEGKLVAVCQLIKKVCPKCGLELRWFIPENQIFAWSQAVHIFGGYYELHHFADDIPPPEDDSPPPGI